MCSWTSYMNALFVYVAAAWAAYLHSRAAMRRWGWRLARHCVAQKIAVCLSSSLLWRQFRSAGRYREIFRLLTNVCRRTCARLCAPLSHQMQLDCLPAATATQFHVWTQLPSALCVEQRCRRTTDAELASQFERKVVVNVVECGRQIRILLLRMSLAHVKVLETKGVGLSICKSKVPNSESQRPPPLSLPIGQRFVHHQLLCCAYCCALTDITRRECACTYAYSIRTKNTMVRRCVRWMRCLVDSFRWEQRIRFSLLRANARIETKSEL